MEKPKIRNTLKTRKRSKNYSRSKGIRYEQDLAREFREILHEETCRTSRAESRLLDACKVDLTCRFLNVQAKNVRGNINYNDLILSIKEALLENIPEREHLPVVVFHKKGRNREYIVMDKSDFYNLVSQWQLALKEKNELLRQ